MDATNAAPVETMDSRYADEYDEPYRFGCRPSVRAPFPFTEHQFARLLIVRSRIQAQPSALDHADH